MFLIPALEMKASKEDPQSVITENANLLKSHPYMEGTCGFYKHISNIIFAMCFQLLSNLLMATEDTTAAMLPDNTHLDVKV